MVKTMVKRSATRVMASIALAMVAIVPLRADVKYTMHMEARMAANAGNDPISQMAGGMLAQMFPAGGLDQLVASGEKGTRIEQKQAFAGIKAGSVALIAADGSTVMLDTATKTWWKQPVMSAEALGAMGAMTPDVKVTKRGEFETIDGMKAEHMTLSMTMAIPGLAPGQLPPGMSPDLTMTYDVWLTDAVKMSSGAASLSAGLLKQLNLGNIKELSDGRMMLKGVMSMFGIEIVMTTREFSTAAVDAALFEIPKDFKEVPAPIK